MFFAVCIELFVCNILLRNISIYLKHIMLMWISFCFFVWHVVLYLDNIKICSCIGHPMPWLNIDENTLYNIALMITLYMMLGSIVSIIINAHIQQRTTR